MFYVTGDTHIPHDYAKLETKRFPEQRSMTKNDYVIICGDFGGIWKDDAKSANLLDALDARKFTTLWVDGNHENFDLLEQYPIEEWNGGKVHFIRPSVIHLMRGQVFTIDGRTFFTMGGGYSIDKPWRIPLVSWWSQEMPSEEEYEEAWKNLAKHDNMVDYIITHSAKTSIVEQYYIAGSSEELALNEFFEEVDSRVAYRHWYFGHIHQDVEIDEKHTLLYQKIVRIE